MRRIAALFALISCFLAAPAWARDLEHYALIFSGSPAIAMASRNDAPAMARARGTIRQTHETAKSDLRTRGIRVTGEADTALNAIFVAVDPSEVDQLKTVPGVVYVAKMPRYRRLLDAAEQLINVPAAWALAGGTSNAGEGVKIAIIDTGIESSHAAFQDPALIVPQGFPLCDVPSDCSFTNNKIIVARSYVAMLAAGSGANPAANSRPDDLSARDHVGHGTAVAMAAAGVTVTGPSDTITGVAPKAYLGNYKVFGSPGVNDFTSGDAIITALEDALNDGMNVAVLSLGGAALYGPTDTGSLCGAPQGQPCDVIAATVQRVMSAGMVVVAAAGNDGASGSVKPTWGTIASPADAPLAIAVAATTNSHSFNNAVTVSGLGTFHSQLGNGPVPATTLTAPLSDVAAVGDPQGCTAPPPGSLAGTIALVQRGTCTFVVKVQGLQLAGAVGAIVINNPGDNSLVAAGGLSGTTSIPAAFVGYDDGQAIRAYLSANPKATAGINPNVVIFNVPVYNQVASFSSRGPVLGSGGMKPDVAAVGTDLYLAAQTYDPNGDLYSANGFIVSQGTSFSTPQIAGVAALVLQAHPGFQPAQVKSAIVDTATLDVTDGGNAASVLAVGGGKANAASAFVTTVTASPSSASFGLIKAGALPITIPIQLFNSGKDTVSLNMTIARRNVENNAHISIDRPALTIAPQGTATLNVTLSGTVPSPGIYEGFIGVQGTANPVQIPFEYVVGDAVPFNIISVVGDGDGGLPGHENSEGGILFQVLDRYGIPVSGLQASFRVVSGGGRVYNSDAGTDNYGFAGSFVTLGTTPGTNVFSGSAGGLTTTFTIISTPEATILPNGAVNAASNLVGQGAAPGSYLTLYGNGFSSFNKTESTLNLPLSINGTSVSFDTPTLSVPGHLSFAGPTQLNVQVPWELQQALAAGQTSAQIKVSSAGNSGALYNLPLANYSPAFFENPVGFAACLDQSYQVVTTANPVAQGSIVQLFLNGLGPAEVQPPSGDPASSTTLSRTLATPTVTIGGITAPLQFSGMAPGFVGLYQVNVFVPNTGPGLQPMTISIGGVQSPVSHIAVK